MTTYVLVGLFLTGVVLWPKKKLTEEQKRQKRYKRCLSRIRGKVCPDCGGDDMIKNTAYSNSTGKAWECWSCEVVFRICKTTIEKVREGFPRS